MSELGLDNSRLWRRPIILRPFINGAFSFGIAFLPLILLLLLVRLFLIGNLEGWWRTHFADPVLPAFIRTMARFDGNAAIAIFVAALVVLLFNRLVLILPILTLRFASKTWMGAANAEGVIQDVRAKLRGLFSDDTEKIALYQAQLGESKPVASHKRMQALGCGGCLVGSLWSVVSIIVGWCFHLAIFDALLRLFVKEENVTTLIQTMGPSVLGWRFQKQAFGVDLGGRSWEFAIALGLLIVLGWVINNTSESGRTLPSGFGPTPVVIFIFGCFLCWFFLEAVFLLYLIYSVALELLRLNVWRFLGRPLHLTIRGKWRFAHPRINYPSN
jgi:hypothetical protein